MAKNNNLHNAKKTKDDEFYTMYEDIQKEVNHYEKHFEGKTVICNCDDPFESNFCKFFLRNFNYLKLKRLICTSYNSSPFAGTQLSFFDILGDEPMQKGHGYVMDITKVPMKNGRGVSDEDIDNLLKQKKWVKELKGDGDFRSDECIEYLKQADIVVTNPPFSLFRDYVSLLMQYEKKFLIIGNKNSITYKEFFPYLKENEVWLGYNSPAEFITPNGVTKKVSGLTRWFTNLDIEKRQIKMVLWKNYTPEEYPRYDNYDAIEVNKVSHIPCDYYELMGVPITFMDSYNSEQFEIVGMPTASSNEGSLNLGKDYSKHIGYKQDGTKTGRTGSTFGACPVFERNDKKSIYYTNGVQTVQAGSCERIFIRRKGQTK